MSLLWLAILLLIIGLISLVALVIQTEYGTKTSVPFSIIMILITSISLGFSIHIFLV